MPTYKGRMTILSRWRSRAGIMTVDGPKNPWGPGNGPTGSDDNGGPRNPWAVPPGGKRGTPGPSALDELLRRARGGGGGGGSGGGRPGIPGAPGPRALWGIGVGLIVLAWLLLTCIHPIGPQQRGVVTWFGRYAGTLEPGIGVTLPAPIADVTRVDVQQIRTENFPESGDAENLTLTGDRNIINLSYAVRWSITNPEDYVFQIAEPRTTVRATAESAMREAVANMTLDDAIGKGRSRIEVQVLERMQHILDEYHSGIRVDGVAVNRAVAPAAVSDAFKDVTAATTDAVSARNAAQGYAQQLIAKAQGEAGQFDRVYVQYKLAPEVTRRRMYYETMEDVLGKSDKTIVEAPGVLPYLPLGAGKRAAEPAPQPEAAK
jgi:membrane protease subunit HflK